MSTRHHDLTMKEYAEFKAICEKQGISYDTEAEYKEAARNLLSFIRLSYNLAREQYGWEQRLKDEPKGFWLDGDGRTCYVCHTNVQGKIWFDKWGLKCEVCQNAFKKKTFPGYILKDKDHSRHITDAQLSRKFGLHSQSIKKLVRMRVLKPRVVPSGPMIFLQKENPDLGSIIEEYQRAKRS